MMQNEILVLKDNDRNKEFSFNKKVHLIEDKRLIKELIKPNIKNFDSSLIFKSMNNIHISDVIQIKVNVAETGTFLVSFCKEALNEEQRNALLEEIKKLKNDEVPTSASQLKKIKDLIAIINGYNPIYSTFINRGDIKIEIEQLNDLNLTFPLLVLKDFKKKIHLEFKMPEFLKNISFKKKDPKDKAEPIKIEKAEHRYPAITLFDIDYAFIFIFSLLGSFGVTSAIFEIMNKENIAIFLSILSLAFATVLVIAVHSTIYRKNTGINPYFRYYLGIFIVVGIAAGIVVGFFISKFVLKTEIEDFNYKTNILLSILVSCILYLSSLSSCRLLHLIIKKRKDIKSENKEKM